MRLIDADERVTVKSFDPMNEEYNYDEMTVERALDFATNEGCPPTIDAIPMEWIEWQAMNAKYNGIKEAADAFDFVLKCWKEEQEDTIWDYIEC